MGTAMVEWPYDVIRDRPAIGSHRKKLSRSVTPPATSPVVHSVPKRSCLSAKPKPRAGRRVAFDEGMVVKTPSRALVMEEVKILKRGEEIPHEVAEVDHRSEVAAKPIMSNTDPIGPEPEILPKQIRLTIRNLEYAGTGFCSSPSPRLLPFPALLVNKGRADETDMCLYKVNSDDNLSSGKF